MKAQLDVRTDEHNLRWPHALGQPYWVRQTAPPGISLPLSYLLAWELTIAWQTFDAAGAMILGSTVTTLVTLDTDEILWWLPPTASVGFAICFCGFNIFCTLLLATLEPAAFYLHLVTIFAFLALLLGLRPYSGLPYTDPYQVFFAFRDGGDWNSRFLTFCGGPLVVAFSSSTGYDSIFHLSRSN